MSCTSLCRYARVHHEKGEDVSVSFHNSQSPAPTKRGLKLGKSCRPSATSFYRSDGPRSRGFDFSRWQAFDAWYRDQPLQKKLHQISEILFFIFQDEVDELDLSKRFTSQERKSSDKNQPKVAPKVEFRAKTLHKNIPQESQRKGDNPFKDKLSLFLPSSGLQDTSHQTASAYVPFNFSLGLSFLLE